MSRVTGNDPQWIVARLFVSRPWRRGYVSPVGGFILVLAASGCGVPRNRARRGVRAGWKAWPSPRRSRRKPRLRPEIAVPYRGPVRPMPCIVRWAFYGPSPRLYHSPRERSSRGQGERGRPGEPGERPRRGLEGSARLPLRVCLGGAVRRAVAVREAFCVRAARLPPRPCSAPPLSHPRGPASGLREVTGWRRRPRAGPPAAADWPAHFSIVRDRFITSRAGASRIRIAALDVITFVHKSGGKRVKKSNKRSENFLTFGKNRPKIERVFDKNGTKGWKTYVHR